MNEALFHFIWKYTLYEPSGLITTRGEPVTVIHPGQLNTHAGPDFEAARIRVGETLLVGNVELHLRNSDWDKHRHDQDKAYQNIILHVVFQDDIGIERADFSTLVLQDHISEQILRRYAGLIQNTRPIACEAHFAAVRPVVREAWLNRLLAERWEEKLSDWKELLARSKGDWSELLYWRLAANFGFKVNATPFLLLAQSLPLKILARHHRQLFQLEALLFGQAGFLNARFREQYPQELQREYTFLQAKYNLEPISRHLWKFLRMRPANFPTIRIAQFAALIHQSVHLFSQIACETRLKEIYTLLTVKGSSYWQEHYRFDELLKRTKPCVLGVRSIDNLVINTVAPVQFLYAHFHGNEAGKEHALALMSALPPEENAILTLWKNVGWSPENAAQSQALLQLFREYCTPKKCLDCAIGLNLLKNT